MSKNDKSVEIRFPSVLLLLTVLLFVAKYAFLPNISLALVFAPIWLPLAIAFAFVMIFLFAALLVILIIAVADAASGK